MRVVRVLPDRVVIDSGWKIGGLALMVLPVTGLCLASATAPMGLGPERLTTTVFLGLTALALIGFAVRRSRRVIEAKERRIQGPEGCLPLPPTLDLRLKTTAETHPDPARPLYQVVLNLPGTEVTLLQGSDPAKVLDDLDRIKQICPTTVEPGWGLSSADLAPRRPGSFQRSWPRLSETVQLPCVDGRAGLVGLLGACTAFVACALGWLLLMQLRRSGPVSWFGAALCLPPMLVPLLTLARIRTLNITLESRHGRLFLVDRRRASRRAAPALPLDQVHLALADPGVSYLKHLVVNDGTHRVAFPLGSKSADWLRAKVIDSSATECSSDS